MLEMYFKNVELSTFEERFEIFHPASYKYPKNNCLMCVTLLSMPGPRHDVPKTVCQNSVVFNQILG